MIVKVVHEAAVNKTLRYFNVTFITSQNIIFNNLFCFTLVSVFPVFPAYYIKTNIFSSAVNAILNNLLS